MNCALLAGSPTDSPYPPCSARLHPGNHDQECGVLFSAGSRRDLLGRPLSPHTAGMNAPSSGAAAFDWGEGRFIANVGWPANDLSVLTLQG